MPYNLTVVTTGVLEPSSTKRYGELIESNINLDLAQAWSFLKRFSLTINTASEHKRQFSKEFLLGAMASVTYRLLHMNKFELTSVNEVVRLGLLAFSSHIFLDWQGMRLKHTYFPHAFRKCLLECGLSGTLQPQVLLWLLIIGSMSVFSTSDNVWLAPRIQATIKLCEAHSWHELRKQLKRFPWIDILHDKLGRAIFETAISSRLDVGMER